MNSGFEDISTLNDGKYGDDWEMIFRIQNHVSPMLMLLQNSYRNFMEMSSKTADDKFLQKKIEKWFSDKHPDKWIPLYSRVTFSDRPYASF
jgi:kynurenine 3-monooxygenase